MREVAMASGGERLGRSASEKERTKMRERQRRGVTTKIFHGLRKHGGYHLSPRADINEVLRELAKEAGWVIEPDGTTYRSTTGNAFCPVCGARQKSTTPTPTSSIVAAGGGCGSGGGECSTSTSPRRVPIGDSGPTVGGGPTSLFFTGGDGTTINAPPSQDLMSDRGVPLALYMYGSLAGEFHPSAAAAGVPSAVTAAYQQQPYVQEAMASNQNTPAGSPLRRA
ncbi:hypothetical protein L1049_009633 [Liquidambar formosana]|uniref:Protein BZR1 homolog n=1 Tax=Liquidambar formosana TaxID=63359 RepID=A0AAP0N637_LIQFO